MAKSDKESRRVRLFAQPEKRHGNFAMVMPKGAQNLKQVKDGIAPSNIRDNWQRDAYVYADEIGEVGFVMNLQANTGAQCALVPQEFDLELKEWLVTEDERALRVHSAFVGPQGGTPELVRRAFLHLGIAGEALLLGTPSEEIDAEYALHWEFLSPEELVTPRGGDTVRKVDGGGGIKVGEDAYVARVFRSHPLYSALADSPLRRVLSICRDVIRLSQMMSAQVDSRLAAGIFYVPEEITFATDSDPNLDGVANTGDEADELSTVEQFLLQLSEHLKAPVEDRTSSSALVPLLMRGPAELFGSMGLIDVARELDKYAQELRREALGRLAAGLDIDPAIMEGKGSLNHWTAFQVDAEFVTKQVRPTGDLLARALTEVYLRQMLMTFEDMTPNDARKFRWVFDPSKIMARTDEAASARVLHTEGVISDEALRGANGFDDSDKPDEEETERRYAEQVFLRNPQMMGPVVAPVLGIEDWAWDELPDPAAGGGPGAGGGAAGPSGLPPLGSLEQGGPMSQRGSSADVEGTGPDQEFPDATSAQQEPSNPGFTMLVDRLAVAGDAAIERALERAASRFVSKARRNPELKERVAAYKGATTTQVLTAVGSQEMALVDCPADDLLKGAWDLYGMNARRWIRSYLETRGTDALRADDSAAFASSELCESLQTFMEQHLHDTLPMQPNQTRVAENLIVNALRSAGVR